MRTIPGCERLEATGPDSYRMVVTAGVGSIKGTYSGEVALTDRQEPHSFLMLASGAGAPGTVSTEVRVNLAESTDGSTSLNYDADAVIGGAVAGVGQRMLAGVAKKMAGEFFAAVDGVLTGVAPALPSSAAPSSAALGAASVEPGVFVAPPRGASRAGTGDFVRGALVGAAIAVAGVLAGVMAGARLARRRV